MADQADEDFLALPERLRARIDKLFNRALNKSFRSRGAGRKRRKLNSGSGLSTPTRIGGINEDGEAASEGGGFVVEYEDEDEGGEGGGFIPDDDADDAGGFIPDDEDEEGGGGFVPEDVQLGEGDGGFIPDSPPIPPSSSATKQTTRPKKSFSSETESNGKIPLSLIPSLLASLNLPSDDDVLNVFRASATGWQDDIGTDGVLGDTSASSRRRKGGGGGGAEEVADKDLGVERKDFRAVCAALMGGDEDEGEGEGDDGSELGGGFVNEDEDMQGGAPQRRTRGTARQPLAESEDDDDDDDEEGFEFSPSDGSSLSSLSSDSEYGASRRRTKAQTKSATKGKNSTPATGRKGKGKAGTRGQTTGTGTGNSDSESDVPIRSRGKKKKGKDQLVSASTGSIKLNSRQKEMVKALWTMLKPPSAQDQSAGGARKARMTGGGNPNILGRDEVKSWARQLGEMWTDEEITDMVSLFSTQHEQRGLSYDDFSQVMVRGRIV